MHCLYCNKRLWLLFSKERAFCSKLHEDAYQDELSAMRRLTEFTVPVVRQALPAPENRRLSEIYRASTMPPIPPVAVPPLCNFVVDQGRPKPVTPDLAATTVLLEAKQFAAPIQFPSGSRSLIALTLDSAIGAAGEIATTATERIAPCRVQSKRSRRIPPPSPTAFSLRTHRRRVR
jgi:hypothetical protein